MPDRGWLPFFIWDSPGLPEDTVKYLKRDIRKVIEKYLNIENADVSIRMDIKREVKQGVKDVKTIQIERL